MSEPSQPPLLSAKHLEKRFGKKRVVQDVSIEVRGGEVVGLLGPNGAGKTTSFYMIVGLIRANNGTIHLNETDLTRRPMHRRAQMGIGYLPQEPSVFRKLSVE
ncbi:MAG: ATP-binding cassette domain-containing protein, partial [Gammaproteobacteria bacterium]|nr:ATP-binding cassette domain-containing protein [Gammaproteobacteria bacterium]